MKKIILLSLLLIPSVAFTDMFQYIDEIPPVVASGTPPASDPHFKTANCLFDVSYSASDSVDTISTNAGAVTNGAYQANDKGGIAYRQSGSYANIKWTSPIARLFATGRSSMTVCMRIRSYADQTGEGYLFFLVAGVGGNPTGIFEPASEAKNINCLWSGTGFNSGDLLPQDGSYHTIIMVNNPTTQKIYLDGNEIASRTGTYPTLPAFDSLNINPFPTWYQGYYGNDAFDRHQIFDYDFSVTDVANWETWIDEETD